MQPMTPEEARTFVKNTISPDLITRIDAETAERLAVSAALALVRSDRPGDRTLGMALFIVAAWIKDGKEEIAALSTRLTPAIRTLPSKPPREHHD